MNGLVEIKCADEYVVAYVGGAEAEPRKTQQAMLSYCNEHCLDIACPARNGSLRDAYNGMVEEFRELTVQYANPVIDPVWIDNT